MSLVHEALQKAEREKQRKAGVWSPPAQKPSPQPIQQVCSTESTPTVAGKSVVADRPAESVGTMSVASHAVSVASTFAVGQSLDQAAAVYPQKKQSGLLPVLIVCVSLVAIVAIVFLVSLAAPMIRESRQTVHTGGQTQPPTVATEPKPNEPAPQPVVASAPVGVTAQQPLAPPAGSVEAGFRLTGVMKDPDGKYAAVINGRVVYESYYVGGATVKNIERDRVTLVDAQGKEIVLRLN
jgi:hypothetical protein